MDKNELKRLERADDKAHKKKSREPLYEWGIQLEQQLEDKIKKYYQKLFKEQLGQSIDWYIIAIAYTLHFNEKTRFGPKRIQDVMDDLTATVNMFNTGEYNPLEYKEILKNEGIILNNKEEKE